MASTDAETGKVVVGTDGSAGAATAADWAVGEARRRQTGVHLLAAIPWPAYVRAYDVTAPEGLLSAGERLAEEAAERLRRDHPDIPVTAAAVLGDPAAELVRASSQAALVVVGARGLGRLTATLVGSVSQKAAALAAGPVVVVRGGPGAPDGPVAVGVDPADGAAEVMRYAADDARRRGTSVRLVHATRRGEATALISDAGRELLGEADRRADEGAQELLREWRQRYPDVPVELHQPAEPPVEALVRAAADASLLVMGSRGHAGLAGLLLGSVSQGVLHRAPVVAVVPVRASGAPGGADDATAEAAAGA